jgi:hypothetical protein
MDDSSKSKNTNANLHLNDALKNINNALEEWDKITNKPLEEQVVSQQTPERPIQELLLKLRDQLDDLSQDEVSSAEESQKQI